MKKIYLSPAIELIEAETIDMLATSLGKYEEEVSDAAEILSRELDSDEDW